jgi:hypothetical protein
MKIEIIKHTTTHNFADGTFERTSTTTHIYHPDNRSFTINELIKALQHIREYDSECIGKIDACIEAIGKIEVCEQVDDLGQFFHCVRFLPVQ